MTELQAVVDIIKSVGTAGQTMFIWYIFKEIIIATMKFGSLIFLFMLAKGIATYIINTVTGIHELRNLVIPGCRGEVTSLELKKIKRAIKNGLKNEETD